MVFLCFQWGLEMQDWARIGSFNVSGTSASYFCQKIRQFMWNFLLFNFKAVFHKIETLVVSTFHLRNNLLILLRNFQGLFIICIFWLVVKVTIKKMLFSLLPWQPSLRVENPYLSTQNQNIKLINSSSFKSNRLLFLAIKSHKWSFPHWLLRALGIAIGVKILGSDQNFKFLFYSIILCKKLFHTIFWLLSFDCRILLYFLKL